MKKLYSSIRQVVCIVILCGLSGLVFGQIPIGSVADFKTIDGQSGSYILTNDIDFSGSDFSGITNFSGTLNGDGYSLKNITITGSMDADMFGVFKAIANATIKNLVIENASVTGGKYYCGILAGKMEGGLIEQCAIVGGTLSGHEHIGSFAGNIGDGSTIKNCYSTAAVTGSAWVGGIVGLINGNGTNLIENCYNTGDVTNTNNGSGSILGRNENTGSSVRNNVNLASKMVGINNYYRILGHPDNSGVLSNNYSLSSTLLNNAPTTSSDAASLHGADISGSDDQAKTETFYQGLGWDVADIWNVSGSAFPTLKIQRELVLSLRNHSGLLVKGKDVLSLAGIERADGALIPIVFSTEDADIEISGTDLTLKAGATITLPREATVTATSGGATTTFTVLLQPVVISLSSETDLNLLAQYPSMDFELTTNITVNNVWTPIVFSGNIDGKGHVISGLETNTDGTHRVAFISELRNGSVRNLGIENARFIGADEVSAIAAYCNGSAIEGCYVANSYIEGNDRVGSIVGNLEYASEIKNCYSTAELKVRAWQTGGLVGVTWNGNSTDTPMEVSDSYFAGTITGSMGRTCGIVGLINSETPPVKIENCVNLAPSLDNGITLRIVDGNTTANLALADNYSLNTTLCNGATVEETDMNYGGAGKHGANVTVEDAKTTTFYTGLGWDFNLVWTFVSGVDYPVLKAFQPGGGTTSNAAIGQEYGLNVSNDVVTLSGLSEKAMISIFNVSGQRISSMKATSQIQYSLPAKGLYLILIEEKGNRSTIKIINK